MKQSGGAIHVVSEEGVGTSFHIYLPRIAGKAEEVLAATPVNVPRGGETVLLVEDQRAVRALMRTMLKRYGYNVVEAGDAEEALRILAQADGGIDMLLADIVLPGLNGQQLAGRARAMHPGLRVLFVSGYTREEMAGRGVGELDGAFLQKPFQPEVLAAAVREVLV